MPHPPSSTFAVTPQGSEGRPPSLACLSVETVHHVLLFLQTKDILLTMSRVNQQWYLLCRGRLLWRLLTHRCFPVMCAALEDYCCVALRRCAQQQTHSTPAGCTRPCGTLPLLSPPAPQSGAGGAALPFDELSLRPDEVVGCCYLPNCLLDRAAVACCMRGPQALLTRCSLVKAIRWEDAYHNLPYLTRVLVCDQRNNRVKRMRLDGAVLAILDEDSGVEIATPSGICLLPDGTAAITEFGLSTVAIISVQDIHPRVLRRFEVGYLPRGIACLPDGNIIVCLFGGSLVKVFSPTSTDCLYTIPVRFRGPSGVAVLPDNLVAITECNGNRVVVIRLVAQENVSNLAGMVQPYCAMPVAVHGSGHYDNSEDSFAEPRGATYLPREGALAVCDSGNERIKVMDPISGRVLRIIYGDFDCVASLAVLPDGHHAVVSDCDHHRLLVIRLRDGRVTLQLGSGDAGHEPNNFICPRCIAVLPTLV